MYISAFYFVLRLDQHGDDQKWIDCCREAANHLCNALLARGHIREVADDLIRYLDSTQTPESPELQRSCPACHGAGPQYDEATIERYVNNALPCNCDEAYKGRNLADPDCPRCQWADSVVAEVQAMLAQPTTPSLTDELDAAISLLKTIVCTEHPDDGVVLLSNVAPSHWDEDQKCSVYDHEHFSPLGDALIELHERLTNFRRLVVENGGVRDAN